MVQTYTELIYLTVFPSSFNFNSTSFCVPSKSRFSTCQVVELYQSKAKTNLRNKIGRVFCPKWSVIVLSWRVTCLLPVLSITWTICFRVKLSGSVRFFFFDHVRMSELHSFETCSSNNFIKFKRDLSSKQCIHQSNALTAT